MMLGRHHRVIYNLRYRWRTSLPSTGNYLHQNFRLYLTIRSLYSGLNSLSSNSERQ